MLEWQVLNMALPLKFDLIKLSNFLRDPFGNLKRKHTLSILITKKQKTYGHRKSFIYLYRSALLRKKKPCTHGGFRLLHPELIEIFVKLRRRLAGLAIGDQIQAERSKG